MEYVLKTNNLTKSFRGNLAVNNVNMTIKKGDIYGFIGKNGAGKTTLMKMVTGISTPTSGNIELFESVNYKKELIRTGCIIENPALYLDMTAKQNLEIYRKTLGITNKNDISSILDVVGLDNVNKEKTKNFSLGMKQRLAIAISLLGNPDFLILDEPINGLDPTGIKIIRDMLLRLNEENQITILISSHILGELSKIATCYGIINNGVLVDEFTSSELRNRCKCSLKIKVNNINKATNILETIIGTTNYDVLPHNTIRLYDNINKAADINSALCNNDVLVESIFPTGQDLEGYFMYLMEAKNND